MDDIYVLVIDYGESFSKPMYVGTDRTAAIKVIDEDTTYFSCRTWVLSVWSNGVEREKILEVDGWKQPD